MSGKRYGRYILKSSIGQGGMGQVYRAFDPEFGREVALKLLPPHLLREEAFQQRFRREAQLIARLEHAAIVPVYDFGQEHGQPYIVMRLMNGGSLTERISAGPLSLAETARIMNRICAALDKAHEANIIHRDIKPDNILFDEEGNAYLADFGIARLAEGTQTMTVIGTPRYMAPEQAEGTRLDARTDVYQMGVVLFEMLTGEVPFKAVTPVALLRQHAQELPPSPLQINGSLPPALEVVILRALAKDPQQRYATTGEMAHAFQRACFSASPPAQPPEFQFGSRETATGAAETDGARRPRVSPWLWGGLGLGVGAVLILAVLFSGIFSPPATPTAVIAAEAAPADQPAAAITSTPTPPPTDTPAASPTPTATITAAATFTPTPAPTPTNSPTPQPVIDMISFPLGTAAYAAQDRDLPRGELSFAGIPFVIGDTVFKSQAGVNPFLGAPERATFYTDALPGPIRLHLLLNTGNGYERFNGEIVGQVIVSCSGTTYLLRDLRLGQDVREWHNGTGVVSTAPAAAQVWEGIISGTTVNSHLDMLSLDLPPGCRDGRLDFVELIDTSRATVGSQDPALNLYAYTVEYNRAAAGNGNGAEPATAARVALIDMAGRLRLLDPQTGASQLLDEEPFPEPYQVSLHWSPDGSQLAVFRRDPDQVEVIRFQDNIRLRFDAADWAGGGWSDTRQLLVALANGTVLQIDTETSDRQIISQVAIPAGADRVIGFSPAPQGGAAVFTFGRPAGEVLIPPAGPCLSTDLTGCEIIDGWDYGRLSWSPDGRFLAKDIVDLPCSGDTIYLYDIVGGAQSVLERGADAADRMPLWSPDGRFLAIASVSRGEDGNCFDGPVWLVDMTDQSRRQLTDLAGQPLSWSPDGAYVLISTRENEQVIVDTDTGVVQFLSTGYQAVWRP